MRDRYSEYMKVWRGSLRAGDTVKIADTVAQVVGFRKGSSGCLAQFADDHTIGGCLVDAEAEILTPVSLPRRLRLRARMALVSVRWCIVDRLISAGRYKAAQRVQEAAWWLHDQEIGLRALKPW